MATLHIALGLAVVSVNLLAALLMSISARRHASPSRPLVLLWWLGWGLLILEFLGGLALWLGSDLPGVVRQSPLGRIQFYVHSGAPLVAIILAAGLMSGDGVRRSAARYAIGALVMALLAALNFFLPPSR